MQVGVYSLEKVLYHGQALEVNCNTRSGEITILSGHEPLISLLATGVLKIIDDNRKEHYIQVASGFLEVRANGEARFLVEESKG